MVTAVIAAREGSRRLPNKNILPFGESNLLIHKIRQLKEVKKVDKIIVSTDSKTMIEMAKNENVDFQKRPYEYCDEKSKTFNEVVEYIAKSVKDEILIWAPCVCPLVETKSIETALEEFLTPDFEYDSIVSAQSIKEYIFGDNKPINFSIEHHVPSQLLPDWHIVKNGFFIAKSKDMEKWKFVYGKNPKMFEISKYEAIDIDDKYDYEIAKILYELKGNKNEKN